VQTKPPCDSATKPRKRGKLNTGMIPSHIRLIRPRLDLEAPSWKWCGSFARQGTPGSTQNTHLQTDDFTTYIDTFREECTALNCRNVRALDGLVAD
jgi:hypothetical protein